MIVILVEINSSHQKGYRNVLMQLINNEKYIFIIIEKIIID